MNFVGKQDKGQIISQHDLNCQWLLMFEAGDIKMFWPRVEWTLMDSGKTLGNFLLGMADISVNSLVTLQDTVMSQLVERIPK